VYVELVIIDDRDVSSDGISFDEVKVVVADFKEAGAVGLVDALDIVLSTGDASVDVDVGLGSKGGEELSGEEGEGTGREGNGMGRERDGMGRGRDGTGRGRDGKGRGRDGTGRGRDGMGREIDGVGRERDGADGKGSGTGMVPTSRSSICHTAAIATSSDPLRSKDATAA
jgi:hypothetical protein